MPWFKIDDSSHSHLKFRRAGNAALGLWLRCGAFSAQNLLEGIVPGDVARDYGTATQAKKLITVGLWHAPGHTCPRCPQPGQDEFIMHDFFEGGRNSTKAQVEAARRAASDRQAKARATTRGEQKAPANRDSFRGKTETQSGLDSAPKAPPTETQFQPSAAGQGLASRRDTLNGVTPSHAMPCHTDVLPYGSTPASSAPDPRPYDTLSDLKQACSAAGLNGVAWNLQASQIERVRAARDLVGVEAMVTFAINSARRYGLPTYASAWIDGWTSLEAPPPDGPGRPTVVPLAPPSPRQASRNALDALADRLRQGESA
jgi:hypothetical protein